MADIVDVGPIGLGEELLVEGVETGSEEEDEDELDEFDETDDELDELDVVVGSTKELDELDVVDNVVDTTEELDNEELIDDELEDDTVDKEELETDTALRLLYIDKSLEPPQYSSALPKQREEQVLAV
jgi:hypothetical protein